MDPESLERDNDRGISALSERVGLLKSATFGIRNEVEAQHSALDRMADTMLGTRGVLGGAAEKFRVVISDKGNRQTLTYVGGFALAMFLIYWLLHR